MTYQTFEEAKKRVNLEKISWNNFFAFESYGVKIGIRSQESELLEEIKNRLGLLIPTGYREISFTEAIHIFSIKKKGRSRNIFTFFKGNEEIFSGNAEDKRVDLMESQIRLTVAEFAENFVFLHAGAIRYKNYGIIIPAKSFSGKTTLVAELAGRGFEYYSDEYAVIDKDGFLHPYPKQLSMRGIINEHEQVDIDVEEYGGKKGITPLRIGLILVSKFKKGARFQPKFLSSGEGIIESIANSVSIRQNPKFVLDVLGKVMIHAKIIKTNRSEAKKFADNFINFLDTLEVF